MSSLPRGLPQNISTTVSRAQLLTKDLLLDFSEAEIFRDWAKWSNDSAFVNLASVVVSVRPYEVLRADKVTFTYGKVLKYVDDVAVPVPASSISFLPISLECKSQDLPWDATVRTWPYGVGSGLSIEPRQVSVHMEKLDLHVLNPESLAWIDTILHDIIPGITPYLESCPEVLQMLVKIST